MENILKYLHMIGLSIWIGSMVTWAVFAPKLNKFDPTKNTTSVLRDSFSKISWISYAVALIAGITIRFTIESGASDWSVVIGALLLAGAVIAFHSVATNVSDAVRGIFNGVMLLLALVALYFATIYI
tara:strand:- start:117 stop:497 length:381 start_codon:yes stop_codon:yes gene_type:complete